MKGIKNHIIVFEHQSIKLNQTIEKGCFDDVCLKALQAYYGDKGVPYFSLTNNGVRFNEYVGVIQVGHTLIEVLPKADKNESADGKSKWRDILIGMLKAVGAFDIHAPSSGSLKLKPNSILDLYIELFIKEVEYLLHVGLIKKYRKTEGNVYALKGSLQFGKHLQHNLTHQERFYVRHTIYDVEHTLHFILYKAISILKHINTNANLHSRIGCLDLHFPEMPDIKVTEATFEKIVYNRKNQSYKQSIEIAKLLLLQYHPDLSKGKNHVLALMFDMNMLWEQFVYVSLRKHKNAGTKIKAQFSKSFWQPNSGYRSTMRPDIVIQKENEACIVLDTKWKNLNGYKPSAEDLRQMYVYNEYYHASKVALVYPNSGSISEKSSGFFIDPTTNTITTKECAVIALSVESDVKKWQETIFNSFATWFNLPNQHLLARTNESNTTTNN